MAKVIPPQPPAIRTPISLALKVSRTWSIPASCGSALDVHGGWQRRTGLVKVCGAHLSEWQAGERWTESRVDATPWQGEGVPGVQPGVSLGSAWVQRTSGAALPACPASCSQATSNTQCHAEGSARFDSAHLGSAHPDRSWP